MSGYHNYCESALVIRIVKNKVVICKNKVPNKEPLKCGLFKMDVLKFVCRERCECFRNPFFNLHVGICGNYLKTNQGCKNPQVYQFI